MTVTDHRATSRRHWKPGSICVICGEKIYSFQQFNWDHLIPMSRGGQRGRNNKYRTHVICNAVKGNKWPFWLRTENEREQVRRKVREKTWLALCAAWEGHPD